MRLIATAVLVLISTTANAQWVNTGSVEKSKIGLRADRCEYRLEHVRQTSISDLKLPGNVWHFNFSNSSSNFIKMIKNGAEKVSNQTLLFSPISASTFLARFRPIELNCADSFQNDPVKLKECIDIVRSTVRDIITPENWNRARDLYSRSANSDFTIALQRQTEAPPTSVVESRVSLLVSDGAGRLPVSIDLISANFDILENCFFGAGPQPTPHASVR